MKRLVLSFWISLLVGLCSLGAQVAFFAQADAREVLVGKYVEVTFTIKNAEGGEMNEPKFPGLKVVQGPSSSVNYSIVNGHKTIEKSFSYLLSPTRVGVSVIPSVGFTFKGKTYKSNPITIRAVKGRTLTAAEQAEQPRIETHIESKEAWVGQQLTLDYKALVGGDAMRASVAEFPSFEGFYEVDMKMNPLLGLNFRPQKEVINGRQYYTQLLRRFAVYPQEAGTKTIGSLTGVVGVPRADRRRDFLGRYIMNETIVETEPITINVKSLPNAPDNFSGAVGNFIARFYSTYHKRKITTDGSFSIGLQVRGSGDGKRINPPKLDLGEGFDVYDPTVKLEQFFVDEEQRLVVQKEFEFIVVPTKPGKYTLRPEFVYFDVDSAAYVTVANERFSLEVVVGSAKPNIEGKENKEITASKQDIRDITKGEIALEPARHTFFGSGVFWGLALVPFLFVGVAMVLKQKQQKILGLDPVELKKRHARKVALNRLSSAKKHLDTQSSKAFFDEISKAMIGYVCDKLQISTSDLSKANVAEKLRSINVPEDLISTYNEIIHNSEIALYAGMDNTAAMQNTYDKTTQLLTEIEELQS